VGSLCPGFALLEHVVESARQPIFNVPFVIVALVAVLGLVHGVIAFALSEAQTNEFLLFFAFLPARYDVPVAMLPGGWGAWVWTFVSYAFIHADLNHLLFNLLWLVAFGTPVARRLGGRRFLAFFLVTAAAGAAAHLAVHFGDVNPMIGASASVSGAMAAAMRFAFQRGGPLGVFGGGDESTYRVPAVPLRAVFRNPRLLIFLAVWFGTNLLFGLVALPGIDQGIVAWEAHIGGFVAGLLGFALFDPVHPPIDDGAGSEDEPIVHQNEQ
jgi:membrane associated rhomboid family serine protease